MSDTKPSAIYGWYLLTAICIAAALYNAVKLTLAGVYFLNTFFLAVIVIDIVVAISILITINALLVMAASMKSLASYDPFKHLESYFDHRFKTAKAELMVSVTRLILANLAFLCCYALLAILRSFK